jgi:hypothetical protein
MVYVSDIYVDSEEVNQMHNLSCQMIGPLRIFFIAYLPLLDSSHYLYRKAETPLIQLRCFSG